MTTNERACATEPGLSDAGQHIIRDMILLALDGTDPDTLTADGLAAARHALIEALDIVEGAA